MTKGDEMLKEYDFSKGVRGKYALRAVRTWSYFNKTWPNFFPTLPPSIRPCDFWAKWQRGKEPSPELRFWFEADSTVDYGSIFHLGIHECQSRSIPSLAVPGLKNLVPSVQF